MNQNTGLIVRCPFSRVPCSVTKIRSPIPQYHNKVRTVFAQPQGGSNRRRKAPARAQAHAIRGPDGRCRRGGTRARAAEHHGVVGALRRRGPADNEALVGTMRHHSNSTADSRLQRQKIEVPSLADAIFARSSAVESRDRKSAPSTATASSSSVAREKLPVCNRALQRPRPQP